MTTPSCFRFRSASLSGAILLAAASLASGAASPANLARSDAGARLTLLAAANHGDNTVRANQALLSDADPLGCALGAGKTTILLSLTRAEALQRFEFLNLTSNGRVSVDVSVVSLPAESPRWRSVPAAGRTFNTPDEMVTCDLGHVEARYLRITFETQSPGRIDTFGLFGAGAAESPATVRPQFIAYGSVENGNRSGEGATNAKAQVLHVSSGSGGAEQHIVDGSLGTSYTFARGDHRPTTVIDLGKTRSFQHVNVAFRSAGSGRLDVYALNRREDADAPAPLAGRQPIGSVPVEGRSGLIRVSVPLRAANVRYVAVVFIPGAAEVDGKDAKDFNPDRGTPRDGRRSSGTGNQSGNGNEGTRGANSPDGNQFANGPDGNSSNNGIQSRGSNGSTAQNGQYGMSADGQNALGSGGDGDSFARNPGGQSGTGGGGANGSAAGGFGGGSAGSGSGSFAISEVAVGGSGGFGNFLGFGGGPGGSGGTGSNGGGNGGGFGGFGNGGGGGGGGGDIASNGNVATGSDVSAFNFTGSGSGGGGAGGGSPLTLVPSLPPAVITP